MGSPNKSKEKKKKNKEKPTDQEVDKTAQEEMQDKAKIKYKNNTNGPDEGDISSHAKENTSKKNKIKHVSSETTEQAEAQGDPDIPASQVVTEIKLTGKRKKRKKNKEQSSKDTTELLSSDKSDPVSCVNDVPKMVEKRKKKINSVPETETEFSISFNEDNEVPEHTKKEKRTKKKRKDFTDAERAHSNKSNKEIETEMPETSQKVSKKKNRSLVSENAEADTNQTSAEMMEHGKQKKRKINGEKHTEEKGVGSVNCDTDLSKNKKKKKKDFYDNETQNNSKLTHNNNVEVDFQPPNRKKKGKVSCAGDDHEASLEIEEADSGKDPNGNIIDSGSKLTGSKKKKKHIEDKSHSLTTATCSSEHIETFKQKKKKKGLADVTVPVDTTTIEEDKAEVPKRTKKRKLGDLEVANELAQSKDRKKAKISEEKVPETSVEEKTTSRPGNTKGTRFGQWDTVSFQSSDQQAKFFRLMGGFKKGNQSALAPSPSQEKANMALGKSDEQSLQRNLQAEFDKALNWKQNRGIGLGFEAAKKKAFFIDKTASKSIKFDD